MLWSTRCRASSLDLEQVRESPLLVLIHQGHKKKWEKSWKRAGAARAGLEEEEKKSLKQFQVTGASLLTGKPQRIRTDDCENKVLCAELSLLLLFKKSN